MGFQFNDELRNKKQFNEYNYREYKSILKKLKLKSMKEEYDSVLFGYFCKLKKLCLMMSFDQPKPEDYKITNKQIDDFLNNDRYVSANLLLKEIERQKKSELNESRKSIIEKYNKQKSHWWYFTMRGHKKHE